MAGYSPCGWRESDRTEHTCVICTTEFRYLLCSLVLFTTSCFMTLETFHGFSQFCLLDLMLSFFFLIGGWLLYHIVLVSAIHQHESVKGVHMSPPMWTYLPPYPTPLDCHRALRWVPCIIQQILTIYFTYGKMYFSSSSQFITTSPSPTVLHVCASITALQVGFSVLFF